jgi:glycosyltransferase involved in cell wall biosynthesis
LILVDRACAVRLLVCAAEAPLPPINGFRLALSAVLGQLRGRHELRVLAFRLPDQVAPSAGAELRLVDRAPSAAIRRAAWLAAATIRRRPFGADALVEALTMPLRDELERFAPDVVHVASGRLAGLGPLLESHPSVLVALDAWHLNVEANALVARGLRRRLLSAEAVRVRRFEATEYPRFGRVVVVSEEDRRALQELEPRLALEVVPNGVDADLYAPETGLERDPEQIVFTGVMSYAPNVTAAEFLARRVLPRVREEHPRARLAIVGREPRRRVRGLGALAGVEVTGEVPDVRPWLGRGRVYACPMLSGTGIKNKLLEAMASGVACVATPLALQGTRAVDGEHVLVAETDAEFARHVVRVLDDDGLAHRLGRAAREYVLAEHDWQAVAAAYERIYGEVLTQFRP